MVKQEASLPRHFGILKNKEVLIGREISNEEYNHLVQISEQLRLFANCQNLFKIFLFNFTDLMEYLISINVHPLYMIARTSQFDEINFNINRHLSNVLSSFRAYVDHIPSQLNRRFGTNSIQTDSYKKKTSEIFDSFFEYRFFTKFRNYCQHKEYPKYNIEYKTDKESPSPEFLTGSYNFFLDPKTLLNSYDSWGSSMKKDLTEMKGLINIKDEVNKLASIMTHFDMFVSNFYIDDLNVAVAYFRKTFDADDFLNVEYCVLENIGLEAKKYTSQMKNLSTDVISAHLRKTRAYQQIEKNEI